MSKPSENHRHILDTPVKDLPIIDELRAFMIHMEFRNLEEMLKFSAADLLKTRGFTYRCLRDLLCLLEKYECEEALKECD